MNKPLVSVVITTKNEEKHIANCLESIKRQTYSQERIEIIIVDHPDTCDRTKEIARKYTDKVFSKGPERSAQRNFGMMEKAQGKYLLYLDADMILSPTVIEKTVAKLDKSGLVALYIPEIVLGNSFWGQVRRFERSFYDGTAIDCVRIIRRDVFQKVGGFDLSLTGPEDWDLDKKIRKLAAVDVVDTYDLEEINRRLNSVSYRRGNLAKELGAVSQRALVYHNETKFSLKKYLSKKSYYLESFDTYIKKWGADDPDIVKQSGLGYRLLKVFIEDRKWKRLVRHPVLAGGMYFLRFLVGFSFLVSKFR